MKAVIKVLYSDLDSADKNLFNDALIITLKSVPGVKVSIYFPVDRG